MEDLLASIKLKSQQKLSVQCNPLPIGSFLKPREGWKFGRKETLKSVDTDDFLDDMHDNGHASFRKLVKSTARLDMINDERI